jgi:hypothetical protein
MLIPVRVGCQHVTRIVRPWTGVGWRSATLDQRPLSACCVPAQSEKYIEGECDGCGRTCSTIVKEVDFSAPLRHWPKRTRRIPRCSRVDTEIIMEALSATHNDIARLVHSMYGEDFVCPASATARSTSSETTAGASWSTRTPSR